MTEPILPSHVTRPDGEELTLLTSHPNPAARGTIRWHGFKDVNGHVVVVRSDANGQGVMCYTRRDNVWFRFNQFGERRAIDATSVTYGELLILAPLFLVTREMKGKDEAIIAAEQKAKEEADKMTDLIRRAHAYADGKSWCSDFDVICEHLGLPKRVAERVVHVTVPVTLAVPVGETSSDQQAEDLAVDPVKLAETLYNMNRTSLNAAVEGADVEVNEIVLA